MNKLTKTAALEIARESIQLQGEALRYTGKAADEVAKFEAAALDIVNKGELLSDEFFAALPYNINDGVRKNGGVIARAIYVATRV